MSEPRNALRRAFAAEDRIPRTISRCTGRCISCTCSRGLPALARLIPLLFYDLVGGKRERMYLALNERRAMVAAQTGEGILEAKAKLVSLRS